MKFGVESNKNQRPELVNGGGINSETNVLSVVTKNSFHHVLLLGLEKPKNVDSFF